MRKIFVCSPFRGDKEHNLHKTVEICRDIADQDDYPVAPHLYYPQFLDDDEPEQRLKGIQWGLRLLGSCDEVWVYGIPTEGMKIEIKYAQENHIPVITKGDF